MWRIYSIHNVMFILHRLTGLALLGYLAAHIWALSTALMGGAAMFDAVMSMLSKPAFFAIELVLLGCVIFHGLNGLRLILNERGILIGRSEGFARATVALTLIVWIAAGGYAAAL